MNNNLPPLSVLNSSSIVNPVQSLILPNQLVFILPLATYRYLGLFPSLSTYLSSSLYVQSMSFSFSLLIYIAFCACRLKNPFIWFFAVHEIRSTNLRQFISKAFILVSSAFLRVQLSHKWRLAIPRLLIISSFCYDSLYLFITFSIHSD